MGDDIVIADKAVADAYLQLMHFLGVDINMSKSLTSEIGVAEFAKRLISGSSDLSPVSPKLIMQTSENSFNIVTLIRDFVGRGASVGPSDLIKFIRSVPGKRLPRDFI